MTERQARKAAAEIVVRRRTRREMSQRELAERMSVTQSTVSHVERGKASAAMTIQTLRTLGGAPREISEALGQ